MTSVLLIGDAHFADSAPSIRLDDYTATGLNKLQQIVDIAAERQPDIIFFLGDLFHRKRPSDVSHHLVNRVNDLLDMMPSIPYTILGNHDAPAKGKSLLYYPISSLHLHIIDEPTRIKDCLFLPASGTGIDALAPHILSLRTAAAEQPHLIPVVVAHLAIAEPNMLYETVDPMTFVDFARFVFYGHLHARTIYRQLNTLFVNPGALLRVSASATEQLHAPAIALVDLSDNRVEEIPIKHRLFTDVFSVLEKDTTDLAHRDRARFANQLRDSRLSQTDTDAIITYIASLDLDNDVKACAIELLQGH